MALRGNLRDFSLPDVFQLVAFSGKTGVLRIRRPDEVEGGVWFRAGEVFFARSDWHGDALGERLVAGQRITPAALQKALAMQAAEPAGGRRLGQILVDEGYVTQGVLEAFVQEQIQDTIFDLMRWEEGEFDFEVLPESVDEDIGLSVSLENIVMEGSRRLEEWGRIRKKIPSMDVVFKMATAPGEGSFEISLKPVEWSLLLLVDGSRSVAELAQATGRTDFDVARIVYGLVCAGLLEFVDPDEIPTRRAEREKRERRVASATGASARASAQQAPSEPAAAPQPKTAPVPEPEPEPQPVVLAPEPEPEPTDVLQPFAAEELASELLAEQPATPVEHHAPPEEPSFLESAPEAAEPFAAEAIASELLDEPVAPAVEPHVPAEEPNFLGDAPEASAHDLSVFEEMVAAVLEAPAEEEPEPAPQPAYEPGELPPSVSQTIEPVADFDASDAASMLGLEPVELAPQPPAPVPTAPAPAVPPTPEPTAPAEPAPQPAPATASQPAPIETPAPAEEPIRPTEAPAPVAAAPATPSADVDFERDLMALGLGEVPEVPAPAEPAVAQPLDLASAAPTEPVAPAAPALSDLIVSEPEPVAAAQTPSVADAAPAVDETSVAPPPAPEVPDAVTAPEPAAPAAPPAAHATTETAPPAKPEPAFDPNEVFAPDPSLLEFEALSQSLGPVAELEQLDRGVDLAGEDIDSLIASLDAEPAAQTAQEPEPIEVDVTLSSVLNDELSALTGAERPTGRPAAKVARIPEPGKVLHRDSAIDKDTLMRIIAGIEKL